MFRLAAGLLLVACVAALAGVGESRLDVTGDFAGVYLPRDAFSPQQVLADLKPESFQRISSPQNVARSGMDTWLLGHLPNDGLHILHVSGQLLNRVDVWWLDGQEIVSSARAGTAYPFTSRDIKSHRVAFNLPQGSTTVLLRLRSDIAQPINFAAYLWSRDAWERSELVGALLYGAFAGAVLMLCAYNAFLGLALKDSSYGYYIGYVACLAFSVALCSGFAEMYLWPDQPAPSLISSVTAAGSALAVLFVNTFLRVPETRKTLQRVGRTLLAVAAGLALLGLFLPSLPEALQRSVSFLSHSISIVCALYFIGYALDAFSQGIKQARFLILGMSWLMACMVVYFSYTYGLLPHSFFLEHFLEYGALGEGLLLSLALADRISILRQEQRQADQKAQYFELTAAKALVTGHDAEKRRVSALLHDSVTHDLLIARQHLLGLPDSDGARRLLQHIEQLRETVRRLSHELHPAFSGRLPLHLTIAAIAERAFDHSPIDCLLKTDEVDRPVAAETATLFIRVTQEAINNIIKHARASHVEVSLSEDNDGLALEITDNGRGFDPGQYQQLNGLGLEELHARAKLCKAILSVDSAPGKGCRVSLKIRLREHASSG